TALGAAALHRSARFLREARTAHRDQGDPPCIGGTGKRPRAAGAAAHGHAGFHPTGGSAPQSPRRVVQAARGAYRPVQRAVAGASREEVTPAFPETERPPEGGLSVCSHGPAGTGSGSTKADR